MNTLQELLRTELPIVQAPMAGVQGSALAVAASRGGGLGSLPCAMLDTDGMRDELSAIRAQTDRPVNVNFFCHVPPTRDEAREATWRRALSPYYRELGIDQDAIPAGPGRAPFDSGAAEVLDSFRPEVVSFHFGLPEPALLERVRALGAKVLCSATTVAEALWLEREGVDAIIAQGLEAGGHRGMFLSGDLTTQTGTFALLPQIARAVNVPVIAAGGVATAREVSAAMALGAAGVQVGTSFLLCPEANTSSLHRTVLKSDAARHTAVTNLFTGRPARGVVNRVIEELGPVRTDIPAFPLATAAITPLKARAESAGSRDFSSHWAGQNVDGLKEVSATELIRELAASL